MIKSAVLAAAAVMGIGSAAGAATVTTERYDMRLRYEGTAFYDVFIDFSDDYQIPTFDIGVGGATFGIGSIPFSSIRAGDIIEFNALARYVTPETWGVGAGWYPNGSTTPECQLGPVDCTDTNIAYQSDNGFRFNRDDETEIYGFTLIGSTVSYYYWSANRAEWPRYNDYGRLYHVEREISYFTVVM